MEISRNPIDQRTADISKSRLTELEAELNQSHENLGRLTSQLDRVNQDLERLTSYDPLTGLGNRTLFYDQLTSFLPFAKREKRKLPLLVLDVNAFKDVNDSLGHQADDHVLREVAKRISHVLRDSDTAARLGGDEFGIVLPTAATVEGAIVVAQKIAAAVEALMQISGHRLVLGVSIGIALYPDNGMDEKGVINLALVAMDEAKRSGGVLKIVTLRPDYLSMATGTWPAPARCSGKPSAPSPSSTNFFALCRTSTGASSNGSLPIPTPPMSHTLSRVCKRPVGRVERRSVPNLVLANTGCQNTV